MVGRLGGGGFWGGRWDCGSGGKEGRCESGRLCKRLVGISLDLGARATGETTLAKDFHVFISPCQEGPGKGYFDSVPLERL